MKAIIPAKQVELFLFSDLDMHAQSKAFEEWCNTSGEPEFQMEQDWYELDASIDNFKYMCCDDKDAPMIEIMNAHGPDTERCYVSGRFDVYHNDGLVEFCAYDSSYFEYCGYEIMETWNKYGDKMRACYDRMVELENIMDTDEYDHYDYDCAYNEYYDTVKEALLDVCKVINNWIYGIKDYAYSFDHFDEWFTYDDREHWYLADGTEFAYREGDKLIAVDTFEELQEVEAIACA